MDNWVICTDTTCDLPAGFITEKGIGIAPLHYLIDGVEYGQEIGEISIEEFYKKIREGKMPTTSATNLNFVVELFKGYVSKGIKILYLSFASAMSASFSNARVAAEQVYEDFPDSEITVIDSTTASAGLNYLVRKLVKLKENGMTYDDAIAYVENVKKRITVHFTVYDLFHLMRGGRLKKSAAILGSVLKIQPELHIRDDGGLEAIGKVRGRKAAIQKLVNEIGECENYEELTEICICHSDCYDDATYLAEKIKETYPSIKEVHISNLSQTLGSHAGPDCLVIGYEAGAR